MKKEFMYNSTYRSLYKNIIKILKISIGSALAIIVADAMGVKYSTSAGVILLLTIVDTSKETIAITLKRIIGFLLSTGTSFFVFESLGYSTISYGIFLMVFLSFSYRFKLNDGLSINAVLVSHYLMEGDMSGTIIANEATLLLIGGGMGTLLNLYIPNEVKYIRYEQALIESDLKEVMSKMAYFIIKEDKSDYIEPGFSSLEEHIESGISYAYANMKNTFFQDTKYFVEYMEMRKQQSYVLHQIYQRIKEIDFVPSQCQEVAEFIQHVAKTFSERNNVKQLLIEQEMIFKHMEGSVLPTNRKEFESRAILYIILKDFEMFLKLKDEFVDNLTEEQTKKFWKN